MQQLPGRRSQKLSNSLYLLLVRGVFLGLTGLVVSFGFSYIGPEATDSAHLRILGCDDPEKAVMEYFKGIYENDDKKLASLASSANPTVLKTELPIESQSKVIAKEKGLDKMKSPEYIGETWIGQLFPDFVRKRGFVRSKITDVRKEGGRATITTTIEKKSGLSLKTVLYLRLEEGGCWKIWDISISSD